MLAMGLKQWEGNNPKKCAFLSSVDLKDHKLENP